MTAPATPRTPSPGDLARRRPPKPTPPRPAAATHRPSTAPATTPVPVAAVDAVSPGKLVRREQFKKFFLYGLRISRMHPHSRLVGHDLLWRATNAGAIAPSRQPSVEMLADHTGLDARQIDVALANLRSRGWLVSRRITEGPRAGRDGWGLAVPAVVLAELRSRRSSDPMDHAR
ncbi:hypothetical protein [Streptomyces sp. CRN 30]|uniref:hypothetical protein n=1 Tax=Streptomyces sp. CRN 30 TaxID=3075613 RepID=UPI002A7F5FB6|nr:hypothetical protein [Streptomyces sp. CRN 30]